MVEGNQGCLAGKMGIYISFWEGGLEINQGWLGQIYQDTSNDESIPFSRSDRDEHRCGNLNYFQRFR